MIADGGIIIVNNVKLSTNASTKEAFSVARKKLLAIGVNAERENFSIYRRSVDARCKNDIRFVYSVAVKIDRMPSEEKLRNAGFSSLVSGEVKPEIGATPLSAPPVVVGTGPCGLFAALLLATLPLKSKSAPIDVELESLTTSLSRIVTPVSCLIKLYRFCNGCCVASSPTGSTKQNIVPLLFIK